MRLGVDGRKIPESAVRGAVGTVRHAHELGLGGVFFRTVLDMSPSLDLGELKEIRAEADAPRSSSPAPPTSATSAPTNTYPSNVEPPVPCCATWRQACRHRLLIGRAYGPTHAASRGRPR